jgi:hypothetical protein
VRLGRARLAGGILDGRPDIAMYEEIDGKR